MYEEANFPLRCKVVGRRLTISIGIETLKFAVDNCPHLYDGERDRQTVKCADAVRFAGDVCRALNDEAEDGSTPVSRMLDDAILAAVENGSEGIDYLDDD